MRFWYLFAVVVVVVVKVGGKLQPSSQMAPYKLTLRTRSGMKFSSHILNEAFSNRSLHVHAYTMDRQTH